jgi:hypothetical protein
MLKVKAMEAESHDELQRVLNEYSLHISSLERMHSEQELYRAILAHLVLQRLDAHTRDLWETDNKGQTPFWPELQQFLKDRRKTLSSMPTPKSTQAKIFQKNSPKPAGKSSNVHASAKSPPVTDSAVQQGQEATKPRSAKCYMCGNDHRLQICPEFINLPIPNRLAKVTEWKVWTSCFGKHSLESCPSKFRCRSCKQRHNTLLHMEQPSATQRSAAHSVQAPQSNLQASATPFSFPSTLCNHASSIP